MVTSDILGKMVIYDKNFNIIVKQDNYVPVEDGDENKVYLFNFSQWDWPLMKIIKFIAAIVKVKLEFIPLNKKH